MSAARAEPDDGFEAVETDHLRRPASPLIGAQVPGWLKALGLLAIGSNEGEPVVVIPKELRRTLRELVDAEDSVR